MLKVVFSALVLAVFLVPMRVGSQAPVPPHVDAETMDTFVASRLRHAGIPGASVAVTYGDKILYLRGFGRDTNGAAVTEDTPFYLASLSKAFTAFALLQLAETGRIDLDRPVQTYLPEFQLADPRGSLITPRHLVTHRSGLTDHLDPEWGWPQPRSLQEAVTRFRNIKLATDPGTRISYHNPNYYVAARLVEVVSQQSFADYLAEHIFRPLNMNASRTVGWMDESHDGAARGTIFAFGNAIAVPGVDFFIEGAGGVISTARDLAAWMALHANGGVGPGGVRLLSEEQIRQIQSPPSDGALYDYRFGWSLTPRRSPPLSHDGGLMTYSAHIGLEPNGGLGVLVLTNASPPNATWTEAPRGIADGIRAIVKGEEPVASGRRNGLWFDYSISSVAFLAVLVAVRKCGRTRNWVERYRRAPVWKSVLNLGKYALVIAAIVFGIPSIFALVESWSWVWMAYYSPVGVASLALIVLSSGAILSARLFVSIRTARTAGKPSVDT